CSALDDLEAGQAAEPGREVAARFGDDAVLARLDRGHVDRDRAADRDAPARGVARDPGGPRAGDEGLGRDAPIVDAGAAEPALLDQRDALAPLGQPRGKERTGLAGAPP